MVETAKSANQTLLWNRLRGKDGPGVDVHRTQQHDMRAHDHLFHEIVFIEQGQGVHHTAAGRAPLRPGDIIVLRPQVWHAYEKTRELRIINCLIDSRLIARFGSLLTMVPGSFELYRQREKPGRPQRHTHLHARPAQARQLLARLNQIITQQQHKASGWRASVALGAMEVLVTCAQLATSHDQAKDSHKAADNHASHAPPADTNVKRSVQAVIETTAIIEAKYHQPLTLTDLAKRVHLSPAHLSRSFSRHMGMSVVTFIHRLRAEEACRLLTGTDKLVTQIASEVGYDEVAYFSRCFRQQLGVSARAYRQQNTLPHVRQH